MVDFVDDEHDAYTIMYQRKITVNVFLYKLCFLYNLCLRVTKVMIRSSLVKLVYYKLSYCLFVCGFVGLCVTELLPNEGSNLNK